MSGPSDSNNGTGHGRIVIITAVIVITVIARTLVVIITANAVIVAIIVTFHYRQK